MSTCREKQTPLICICCKGSLLFGEFFCYLPNCKNYLNSLRSKEYEEKIETFNNFQNRSVKVDLCIMKAPEKKNCYSGYFMIKYLAKKQLELKLSGKDILNIKSTIVDKKNKITRDEFLSLCKSI